MIQAQKLQKSAKNFNYENFKNTKTGPETIKCIFAIFNDLNRKKF
jgi:hypothetical protein